MNINLKTWVAALHSGRYPPGKRMLRSINNRYCCLGVGCDLMSIDLQHPGMRWSPYGNPEGREFIPFETGGTSDGKMPPRDFADWLSKPMWWDNSNFDMRERIQLRKAAPELAKKAITIINAWADDKKELYLPKVPCKEYDSVFGVLAWLNDNGASHPALADIIEHLDKNGI